VLVETLDLAQMINADALSLFEGHDRYGAKLRDAERPAA
jgi:hypothetical protein